MHSDYYTLDNGLQAVDYIFDYSLGFSYGNAFKYVVRAGRKEGNSAEKDLIKALDYVSSADKEYSFITRMLLRMKNKKSFNQRSQFAARPVADILSALILFEKPAKVASFIIKYMKIRNIAIPEEFKKYDC